eukprot:7506073-Pyramimonas_sp.AAC.1
MHGMSWLVSHTGPRAKGRRGGLPPEFQDVILRNVLATKAYTKVLPGRALLWVYNRLQEIEALLVKNGPYKLDPHLTSPLRQLWELSEKG